MKKDFKNSPKVDFKYVHQMKREEAEREIEALREGKDHHDYLYYVKNRPAISDALYDSLFRSFAPGDPDPGRNGLPALRSAPFPE